MKIEHELLDGWGDLLSKGELASLALTGCIPSTAVHRLIDHGKLPGMRKSLRSMPVLLVPGIAPLRATRRRQRLTELEEMEARL